MTKRMCVNLSDGEYLKFKREASKTYKFTRGYTNEAMHDAIKMWFQFEDTYEGVDLLLKIAKKKYPNLSEKERIKKVRNVCKIILRKIKKIIKLINET